MTAATSAGIPQVLAEAMERDPRVMVLGESVGRLGGIHRTTRGLLDRFGPDRIIDTPLSEAGLVGFAIGLARAGKIPVITLSSADRIGAAADPIARELAGAGDFGGAVVLRAPCGGPFDAGAPAGWLAGLDGLNVAAPATAADAAGLLRAALGARGPSVLLEPIAVYGQATEGEGASAFGQARVVRAGQHASALSWGAGVEVALAAAESLAESGYSVEVIDLRSLRPLDRAAVAASVQKTGRAVVADPDGAGGFGRTLLQDVLELAFLYLESPPQALERPDAAQLAAAIADSVRY